jgi:hypothetical protein
MANEALDQGGLLTQEDLAVLLYKVVRFYCRGYSLQEIRELTDMSERLIQEYLDLFENYKRRYDSLVGE